MPKNKDVKRLTRSRMKKTGESYTTARLQLLEKKKPKKKAPPAVVPSENYARITGMSDEAVKKKTGCVWERWVKSLDHAQAFTMTHKEIAQHIHDKYDISGWWAQMVTVGYERIKGLRDVGQRRGGTYDANKSKTFPVEVARLYRAFSVARTRSRWLPGVKLVVTSATPSKSMRIKWDDGTAVEANFTDKGQKSQVALQHRKLPSKAEAEKRKAFWGDRLEALKEILG